MGEVELAGKHLSDNKAPPASDGLPREFYQGGGRDKKGAAGDTEMSAQQAAAGRE